MLVGRTTECACIEAILESARTHGGEVLLLRGGPGVGKTALLRFAREQATGMTVLETRAARAESAMAGAALSQLLPDLDTARPARCATALRRAAAETPLLLLVDDAQWLDPASSAVVAFVARRLRGAGIAMLVATREEGEPAFELPHEQVLTLRGLDLAAASALLPPALPQAVLERLRAQTTGNPLALRDLGRVLAAAQLGGTEPLPDPLPLGPRLLRELAARFDPLSAAPRRALVIAAAHEGGDLELLARALQGRGLDLAALEDAETAGIVTIAAGRLTFADPLLRSAAYHCASPASRRDAHAALAAVPGATDAAQRARHLVAAALGPSESIARALDAAAGAARGTPAAAGQALEAAARLTPDGGRRTERLIGAAQAHHRAGDAAAALDALDRALAGTEAPRLRADVQHARAQVDGMRRPLRETRAALVAEADRVQPFDRACAAALLVDAATLAVASGEPRESLRLAELATAAAKRADRPTALMASLLLGAARILCGEAATGCPLLERARPLLRATEPSVFGAAGSLLAVALLWIGRFEESRTLQIDVIRRIRAEGDVMALPYALQGLALAEYLCGDWRAARPWHRNRSTSPDRLGSPGWSASRTSRSASSPVVKVASKTRASTWRRPSTSRPRSGSGRCARWQAGRSASSSWAPAITMRRWPHSSPPAGSRSSAASPSRVSRRGRRSSPRPTSASAGGRRPRRRWRSSSARRRTPGAGWRWRARRAAVACSRTSASSTPTSRVRWPGRRRWPARSSERGPSCATASGCAAPGAGARRARRCGAHSRSSRPSVPSHGRSEPGTSSARRASGPAAVRRTRWTS